MNGLISQGPTVPCQQAAFRAHHSPADVSTLMSRPNRSTGGISKPIIVDLARPCPRRPFATSIVSASEIFEPPLPARCQ
jgi:hypothetical protein